MDGVIICVSNVPASRAQLIVKMEDVFGAQIHALVVIAKQAKAYALAPTITVDGIPPTANAINVHITQLKYYVIQPLDVLLVPVHVFLVLPSQPK